MGGSILLELREHAPGEMSGREKPQPSQDVIAKTARTEKLVSPFCWTVL